MLTHLIQSYPKATPFAKAHGMLTCSKRLLLLFFNTLQVHWREEDMARGGHGATSTGYVEQQNARKKKKMTKPPNARHCYCKALIETARTIRYGRDCDETVTNVSAGDVR